MGGSSSPTLQPVNTSTTTRDPWGPAQPYLQSGMQAAQNLYGSGIGYVPYGGQAVAPLDPLATGAIANWSDTALAETQARGSGNVRAARDLALQQVKNYGLTPQMQELYGQISGNENPYLQGSINAQMDKVNAAMSGAGRYGSGLHQAGIAQAIAPTLAQDFARRQAMQNEILQQGAQRAGNWAQVIPGLDQARWDPARDLLAMGGLRQQNAQANLEAQRQNWNAWQARDWEQLQRYNAAIQGAGALGGTTVGASSQYVQQPSWSQRLLGGAMTGAGMGSMFGPIGMGAGALGGGLLGMMG